MKDLEQERDNYYPKICKIELLAATASNSKKKELLWEFMQSAYENIKLTRVFLSLFIIIFFFLYFFLINALSVFASRSVSSVHLNNIKLY